MKSMISGILFDGQDWKLLKIVNQVLDGRGNAGDLNELLYPYLHPHGIKELAESRGLRMAYAVSRLIGSLDAEKRRDRLKALQSLRDEVLNSADSHLRKNTARVLLQIMKELVRTRDDPSRQLELAHDFRSAVSGKPRIVRRLLREYHLMEMPEDWNQVAFDSHVHDAYTRGRKLPAHLVMDAWIKGIRRLTVIYYNYLDPAPAMELLEAAEIMGIDVRMGVELQAVFRGRTVQLTWVPRGFSDSQDFVTFLTEPHARAFMDEGREITECQHRAIPDVLEAFNERCLPVFNDAWGLRLTPLDPVDFLSSLGTHPATIPQLAEFIHAHMVEEMRRRVSEPTPCERMEAGARPGMDAQTAEKIRQMDRLDSEAIADSYLNPLYRELLPKAHTLYGGPNPSPLHGLSPSALIGRLSRLHSGFRIVLNLEGLDALDVLELLYDCHGSITHLETFNFKDYTDGKDRHYAEINQLQQTINHGDIFALTRVIRGMLARLETTQGGADMERSQKFHEILRDATAVKAFYKSAPLKSSIGSDSSGHSNRHHGMGFALRETLPPRVQRHIGNRKKPRWLTVPVSLTPILHTIFVPKRNRAVGMIECLWKYAGNTRFFTIRKREWEVGDAAASITSEGNLLSLGGTHEPRKNGLQAGPPAQPGRRGAASSWRYMNGTLKNALKISVGFAAAALTFMHTQDWWFLIYFGAPIWFAVTGVRNVLQSIFGGGGITRPPLLRWNNYVSMDRMADSLLYTGLSVPLLEYFLKTLIMDETFHITVTTGPVLLYSILSIVNGLYIAAHNILRGLQREAVLGNLFRSILNIPLSIAFDAVIGAFLSAFGVTGIDQLLQQWASIISKTSSDVVAAVIEGLADRHSCTEMRRTDYSNKFAQVFGTNERLETMFPEFDGTAILESSNVPDAQTRSKISEIRKIMIVNALDLLYFWMYQPRGRSVCHALMAKMSRDERNILVEAQGILRQTKEITMLFAGGLVSGNFSRPLAFYLAHAGEYLEALQKTVRQDQAGGNKPEEAQASGAEEVPPAPDGRAPYTVPVRPESGTGHNPASTDPNVIS